MEFFLLFIGILTVLRPIKADCVQDTKEAKPHEVINLCTAEDNWALLPHPHDCKKFFVCANHVPEEFECEPYYYYDAQLKRCVLGSCTETRECQSWIRSVSTDCATFELCENGDYKRFACPDNHYFDNGLKLCQPIKQTPQHLCSCILPENSLIENNNDCETYYMCMDKHAVLKECPRGSYFDARLNSCLVDLTGVCLVGPTVNPQENDKLDICNRLGMRNTNSVIFVPDTEECQKFYMCVNGRVIPKQCPVGFYYDRESSYCRNDSNGICEALITQAKKKKDQQEIEANIEDDNKEIKITNNEHVPKPANPPQAPVEQNPQKPPVQEHEINPPIAENPQSPPVLKYPSNPPVAENPQKTPAHVSLSYTHLKVDADKGVLAEPTQKEAENNIEVLHTDSLKNMPAKGEIQIESHAKGEIQIESHAKGEIQIESHAKGEIQIESHEQDVEIAPTLDLKLAKNNIEVEVTDSLKNLPTPSISTITEVEKDSNKHELVNAHVLDINIVENTVQDFDTDDLKNTLTFSKPENTEIEKQSNKPYVESAQALTVKLPLAEKLQNQLSVQTNTAFDKLSSKFMVF